MVRRHPYMHVCRCLPLYWFKSMVTCLCQLFTWWRQKNEKTREKSHYLKDVPVWHTCMPQGNRCKNEAKRCRTKSRFWMKQSWLSWSCPLAEFLHLPIHELSWGKKCWNPELLNRIYIWFRSHPPPPPPPTLQTLLPSCRSCLIDV